jgi:diguanylate cyclase (GGDEF)-like protein
MPAWQGTPGSTADAERLRLAAVGSRAMSAGAVLVGPGGVRLSSYLPAGHVLPAATDPGWATLRAAVIARTGAVPISGALQAGTNPVVAVGIPVTTRAGATVMLIGLSDLRGSALQKYIEHLVNRDGRRGYLLDSDGVVLAGPKSDEVGKPLRYPHIRSLVTAADEGIHDVAEGRTTYTVSLRRGGDGGWTSLTLQNTDQFLGPLRSASRRAQAVLVLLLLTTGTLLLLLNRRREQALRDVALTDELTGLHNRRGWFAVAGHELERARRGSERRGLLFIDLDGLKQINDGLGHREGDRALVTAAEVLRGCARASDVLGRLGGDEFVLLLGDGGTPDVIERRVQAAVDEFNESSIARFELRLSIGTVVRDAITTSLEELVRLADTRMYADKATRPLRSDGIVRPPRPRDGRTIERVGA